MDEEMESPAEHGVDHDAEQSPAASRRWVWMAPIGFVVVVVVVGGLFLVGNLTVSNSTHDDVLADLDATAASLSVADQEAQTLTSDLAVAEQEIESLKSDLTEANSELDTSRAEATSLRTELDTATEDLSAVGSELDVAQSQVVSLEGAIGESEAAIEAAGTAIEEAHAAVVANMVNDLFWTPEAYDFFVEIGVPVEIGDQLIDLLGLASSSWEAYVNTNALFEWRSRVEAVDDPALTQAWGVWFDAAIDSDEEFGALVEVQIRLYLAVLEALADAQDALAGS